METGREVAISYTISKDVAATWAADTAATQQPRQEAAPTGRNSYWDSLNGGRLVSDRGS